MDDGHIWGELLIIILLVLANGACSLAEIAIVGARKTKLQEMIDAGSRNAVYALRLAEKKEELFSTIQVGITTISIITGMFSGASLAGPLGRELEKIPFLAPYAQGVSMVTVMVLVTYFSLIIGELVPKWVAIAIPEKAACAIARPMILLATVCRPLVLFSTWSTKVVVNLIGVKMGGEQPVSEEEIRVLLQQGAELGTFDKEEPEIIDNVFELNDRTAADCMTARPQLTWLDLEDTEEKIWKDMMETTHFRLPVGSGSLDDFKGLADLSEVLMDQHLYPDKPLKASLIEKVRQPLFIPETLILTKLLRFFRTKGVHEAVVIDEYGTLSGLITLHDVLEEIVGDMPRATSRTSLTRKTNLSAAPKTPGWWKGSAPSMNSGNISTSRKSCQAKRKTTTRLWGALSPTCSATFRKKRKKQPMTDSHSKSWTATTAEWIRYW